jgi:hypothetical protein
MDLDPVSTPDWFPMELDAEKRELTWLHLPGGKFLEPFFEDTVSRNRRSAPSINTPLEALRDRNPDAPAPGAIFFHSSRCGSTLVMQLLSRVPGCRTLSEPPLMDTLLHLDGVDDALITGLLRAFAKPSDGLPPKLFLKTDCWHLPHLNRLRRILPQTPCYFIYRDPAAILRSHRRERGSQMVPGLVDTRLLGIDPASVNPADLDGYAERVLAAIFQQGVAAVESGEVKPIAYGQLPHFLWETLGSDLGLSESSWTEAKARASINAKQTHLPHEAAADFPIKVPEGLAEDYAKLEALRSQLVGGSPSEDAPC